MSTLPIHPAIIWLTGLSGSGKTTLATLVSRRLQAEGLTVHVVDGDYLRGGLSADLGFSDRDRRENIRRASEVALLLAEQGAVVLVTLISPFREDRDKARRRAQARAVPFHEVYINATLEACERRDPKFLYKKARAGQIAQFTGIDSPYEPPLRPGLEIRTDREDIEGSAHQLHRFCLEVALPSTDQPNPSPLQRAIVSFWQPWAPGLARRISRTLSANGGEERGRN